LSKYKPRTKRVEVAFSNYEEYIELMTKYKQPSNKIFDPVSYQSFYGNDVGHEVLKVSVAETHGKAPKCKIWDCKRRVTMMPSGNYFSLCDVHKLNKRNNGSDYKGTIKSHLSGPFRYFSHRLIAKVVEQVGDFKDSSGDPPSVEEMARADYFHESTGGLPNDQLHLDPQVIGRITLGLRLLDNKGNRGDKFMDFYYMNKYYAKHKYDRDSKPEKLIRYVWNHLLRFQEIDRVKLLAILIGLKVANDNNVDGIKAGERREYIQIQTAKMLLRQLKPFTKVWAQPGPGPNNFKVKPKLNKKSNIRFGKEALELADRVLMGPGGKKIDEYVLKEALERQKRLYVGFDNEGVKLYRPAVKLIRP
jgi:hypothetical protein